MTTSVGPGDVGPNLSERRAIALSDLAAPMVGLLVLEFVLGMALNLFLALPSGGGAVAVLESSPVLVLHVIVALLLVGITGRAVAIAVRGADRRAVGMTGFGLVSAIVAGLAGASFTFGSQSAGASMAMALGFAGVLISAAFLMAVGQGRGRRRRPSGVESDPEVASRGSA